MTLRSLAPTGALALALLGGSLAGCDSASDEPAALRLDVAATVGANAFQAGQPFTVNGVTGELDIAQAYLSGITLLHEDGREIRLMADSPITVRAKDENDVELQHTIDERVVFANFAAGPSVTSVGEVPAGRYTGLRFLLGVEGLDNRIAPEDAPAGHALAPQDPTMHWNWNAGYVFLRLDGLLDIDGDGAVDASTGTPRDPASGQWRLHSGGATNAITVTLDEAFELDGGTMQDLRLSVDIAAFVDGLDLGDASKRWCMTGGCQDVVDMAKGNASDAFSLVGVRASTSM